MVLDVHRDEIKKIAAQRNAETIALIGSVARGEHTEDSDFDFLVSFKSKACLMDHAELLLDLDEVLGRSVDVISRDAVGQGAGAMLDDAITL